MLFSELWCNMGLLCPEVLEILEYFKSRGYKMGVAALSAQGVCVEESLYVDDYRPEAEGAREQGFVSFWLDRTGKNKGEWIIHDLLGYMNFEKQNG